MGTSHHRVPLTPPLSTSPCTRCGARPSPTPWPSPPPSDPPRPLRQQPG